MSGPDRAAQAAALRAVLGAEAPQMLGFLDEMKAEFGASLLFVETTSVKAGSEPEAGVQPYIPLPPDTWPYPVGGSPPADFYKPAAQRMKKGRRVKR